MTRHSDALAIRRAFETLGPVAHIAELATAGLPSSAVARAERQGILTRVGKAAFALESTFRTGGPWNRFRLRSIGYALAASEDIFLTAWSAASVMGIPVISGPPRFPTALRPGNPHRGTDRSPHARVRTGALPVRYRCHGRVRAVSLGFAAMEIARRGTAMDALVALDHALNHGVDADELAEIAGLLDGYAGMRAARWALRHADARSESPLETLGRLAFIEQSLPAPLSNVWVDDGRTAYRADHLDPKTGVVLEGDGGLKYNNRPDAHRVVEAQNSRTQWFRQQGYGLERYDWAIARHRRPEIVRRFRRAVSDRPGVPLPANWSLSRPLWL